MVLTFLMTVGLKKQYTYLKLKHTAVRTAFFTSIGFGICIEILQHTMGAGRSGDLIDVLCNTIGCLAGIIAFKWIYIW
jgi:VanZ family protein